MNELDPTQLDRQARDIFLRALEMPSPEARTGYLEGVCQGNSVLRARVEALLQAHSKDSFLENAVVDDIPTAIAAPIMRETEGTLIDRYKLLEKLGEGGFGAVWLAEQKEPVRRKVALKIIKLGMDTRQVVARFEAERQALALMDHPNIAKVLDAGATDNGRPYFVMELVRGIPITKFCDENRLSAGDRLELFIKICQAVQHAHQKGIIHRDIKPSNILVTLHDGVPVPKVIDFGIAKATQGELTDKTIHTRFQQFIGTPAYMSPEQAEMSGLDIDTRSDIYSLGVLLYELLTGKTPLDGRELLASGLDEMRRAIREKEPLRPSTRLETLEGEELTTTAKRRATDAPKLIHLLRGDLDWIVMKCLEKDRTRRYETANGLAADLKRHLTNEPVVARPPSRTYRIQKMLRRNKLAFATAAAITSVLILGIAVSTWQAVRATSAQRKEGEQRQAAQEASRQLRQTLYVSDMAVAWQSWAEGDAERTRKRLDGYLGEARQTNDLRGFEWRYLWGLSRPDELDIIPAPCTCARYSPDGQILAMATGFNENGMIRLWDTSTRKELRTFKAFASTCFRIAFSPDGRVLASVSRVEPHVKLWAVETGQLLGTLTATNQETAVVVFSPDGKRIATLACSAYTTNIPPVLKVWDAMSHRELFELKGHRFWAAAVDFSPDGKMLATADGEGFVKVWDLEAQREIRTLTGNSGFVMAVRFSPIGRILATGDQHGTIILWDWLTGNVMRVLTGHQGPVYDLAISRDGRRLASASRDHTARLWELTTGEQLATYLGHSDRLWSIDFSPDGQTLATAGNDGTVRLWRAAPKSDSDVLRLNAVVGFSPDGRFLVENDWDKEVETFRDPVSREVVRTLPGKDIKFSDSAKLFGIVRNKTDLIIYQTDTLREVKTIKGSSEISLRGFAANGRFIIFLRANRSVITDLEQVREVADLGENLDLHLFTTDSRRLIATDSSNTLIRVWDVDTWKVSSVLAGHRAKVSSLAISPDGQTLASGSDDTTIRLWDLRTLGPAVNSILQGNSGAVYAVAFSPDGRTLAAGSYDGAIKLWSVSSRQEFGSLKGHLSWIAHLEFCPDGRMLLSQSYDGTTRLWHAPTFEEIDSAVPLQRDKKL
jgi:WD40 repeat protein/serine/threonine protein kinase